MFAVHIEIHDVQVKKFKCISDVEKARFRVIDPYDWEETADVKVFPKDRLFLEWLAYAIRDPSKVKPELELRPHGLEIKRLSNGHALILVLRPRTWSSEKNHW
ncbi:Protein of unknown function [Pyronema omphalodes CBS 100304]|uniref:Uncharacterized protein n=1 Tax=Pyronema omphalodes (strain CBS 100304) TaxID=1076935 RepID=U4LMQ0_PYROM|nr:Protein of unknown function [Pyronema omphalodes CBS 100304]